MSDIEGVIRIVDLNSNGTVRIINEHKGVPITSVDSIFKEETRLTYWLAVSKDRRVSVWNNKLNEDSLQLVDWLKSSDSQSDLTDLANKTQDWSKYPKSLAQFAPCSSNSSTKDLIIYIGHGLKKEIVFYNFIKKQIVRTMSLTEWPECFAVSPKCNLIALGTKTRLVQLKDYSQGTFQDYAQHSDTVAAIHFSNDGKKMYTSAYNEIFIWDVLV